MVSVIILFKFVKFDEQNKKNDYLNLKEPKKLKLSINDLFAKDAK